jgi:hypothetical protein
MLHNFSDEMILSLCIGHVNDIKNNHLGALSESKRHDNFTNVKISEYYNLRKAKNYNDIGIDKIYSLLALFSKMMFLFYYNKVKNSSNVSLTGAHQREALIERIKVEFLLHHPFDTVKEYLDYFLKDQDYNRSAIFTYTSALESRDILQDLDLGGRTLEFITPQKLNEKGCLYKRQILESYLLDSAADILFVQFSQKAEWVFMNEIKYLVDEIYNTRLSDFKNQDKRVVFLGHYVVKDLMGDNFIKTSINFQTADVITYFEHGKSKKIGPPTQEEKIKQRRPWLMYSLDSLIKNDYDLLILNIDNIISDFVTERYRHQVQYTH